MSGSFSPSPLEREIAAFVFFSPAIEHGKDQRADLIAVYVSIGADNDLVPTQSAQVETLQILRVFVLHLHTAAQHLHQVGDDIRLEDPDIVGLQAVQDLSANRHDALKLCVP